MVARLFIFAICCCSVLTLDAQDNPLQRKVSVNISNERLEDALDDVAEAGEFHFSYNSGIIPVDSLIAVYAQNEEVRKVLGRMLPDGVDQKVSGNYVILLSRKKLRKDAREKSYEITGTIINRETGEVIANATVFEIDKINSALTDASGNFRLLVDGKRENIGLAIGKQDYFDTVFVIQPVDANLNIGLKPKPAPVELSIDSSIKVKPDFEEIGLVKFFASSDQLATVQNMDHVKERRAAQLSLVPLIGTNRQLSGVITNNLSFNILAGYNGGVNGLEIGGLFNMDRLDVKGLQIGGLGNVVGGKTTGVQLAGLFNYNHGSVSGLQLGGFANVIWDTINGVQLSGITNVLRGGMRGAQIAGIANVTTRNVDGFQLGGISNVAVGTVDVFQMAGIINYGGSVGGAQIAGIMNVSAKKVRGVQLAGIINASGGQVGGSQIAGLVNLTKDVNAAQIAAITNISWGEVNGLQLSLLNIGNDVNGSQLGLINISDTMTGLPIGLLNFVVKGYHKFEVSTNEVTYLNLAFKTGMPGFYNIFTGGYQPNSDPGGPTWSFGYGFGGEFKIKENGRFNLEMTGNQFIENGIRPRTINATFKLNLSFGAQIAKMFAITAGPSINAHVSKWKNFDTGEFRTQVPPYSFFNETLGNASTQIWIGGNLALRFL